MQVKTLDFRDTILDWEHLQSSFPAKVDTLAWDLTDGRKLCRRGKLSKDVRLLMSLHRNRSRNANRGREWKPMLPMKKSKFLKLIHILSHTWVRILQMYFVWTPFDTLLLKVRISHWLYWSSVEAINSGSRPGLTVIIGPPGTGKTDVATQIISNIYHNFPEQRTLLVARSNQALNQLFEKIVALDIADRHLLRLGHGEEGLNTEASFGKSGRVEYFLVCVSCEFSL